MNAFVEHTNITVANPQATAAWMAEVFGWHVRWSGDAIHGGHSVHVGSDTSYVALYSPQQALSEAPNSYGIKGGLNHVGVVVEDLDAAESVVKKHGFSTYSHADYEPGRRFYFEDENGIEFELVQYD
ncbi:MAG: VOC family protein [Rhodobacteraceae bacterium]|nr:VOC family protein [Paracoccaceae bacterium]